MKPDPFVSLIRFTSEAIAIRSQKDNALPADWDIVKKKAEEYEYAEHPNGNIPTKPFINWPKSNYYSQGSNSNVFIRWLLKAAGIRNPMIEMLGYHIPEGVSDGYINPPPGGGTWGPVQ